MQGVLTGIDEVGMGSPESRKISMLASVTM